MTPPGGRVLGLPREVGPQTGVLIAVGGLALFFVFIVAARHLEWLVFRLGPVAAIFGSLILLNLCLAPSAVRWAAWRPAATLYEALHAVVLSAVLHFLGGIGLANYLMVYAFLVIHTKILRPTASGFVTANACAGCYALLALLYGSGWLAPEHVLGFSLHPGQEVAFVLFAALALNFLALYAQHHNHQLQSIAGKLQEMVTARTRELTRVNTELEHKARMLESQQEEHRSFVFTVAHDLKAPVNALLHALSAVLEQERGRMAADSVGDLERAVRLTERTENMIRDLMEVFSLTSRTEDAQLVELDALMSDALDALRTQIESKQLRVEVLPLPAVWGQPGKLGHVFVNLLQNAVEYAPAGRGMISVSGVRRNGAVRVCVRDNGSGIPSAFHRSIFDLFQQVPGRSAGRGGSGIGLAIVRRVVEAHRGAVWVESAPDQGSRFFVELPVAASEHEGQGEPHG